MPQLTFNISSTLLNGKQEETVIVAPSGTRLRVILRAAKNEGVHFGHGVLKVNGTFVLKIMLDSLLDGRVTKNATIVFRETRRKSIDATESVDLDSI